MREIEFRGKREGDGEWVFGDLIHDIPGNPMINLLTGIHEGEFFLVRLETVGQYTGLKDKNGVKVFEGDIVIISYMRQEDYDLLLPIKETRIVSIEHNSFGLMSLFGEWPMGYLHKPITIEVIGNIHDNPELMEVKE
jgi:hypothetical protein